MAFERRKDGISFDRHGVYFVRTEGICTDQLLIHWDVIALILFVLIALVALIAR